MVSLHQFIGRAYLWAEIARVLHSLADEHLLEWVVDVREIPSQQDANTVDCRNRDVQALPGFRGDFSLTTAHDCTLKDA